MNLVPAEPGATCAYCHAPAVWCDLDLTFDRAFYCADHSTIGYDGRPIVVGSRIELHPGCDLWVQGARYGDVVALSLAPGDKLRVTLDRTGARLYSLPGDRCRSIDTPTPVWAKARAASGAEDVEMFDGQEDDSRQMQS